MKLAPIVLFVYNRPDHTRKVLESIFNDPLSYQTDILIFADGARSEADHANVEQVRLVIREYSYENTRIIESSINQGLAKSIITGLSWVFDVYNSAIVLEDDIVINPGFLTYMNQTLNLYENEQKVAGISAFKYPTKKALSDTYFLPIGCSWGWATWRRTWNEFETDGNLLSARIIENDLIEKFNFGGYGFYDMLESQNRGRIDSWAIRFYASFFLKEQFFLYPKESFVTNIGFDGSGTHSRVEDERYNSKVTRKVDIKRIPILLDKFCVGQVERSFTKKKTVITLILERVKKGVKYLLVNFPS